tara:strand:+ start:3045 stop:4112 length:1068 start_codon:yes stop_codon:yes gene_type:complete
MLLRELYEAGTEKVVAVMPGGYHPFHPGHKSLYDWAVKTFGNVYVAATNDTAARPFPFDVKKKLAVLAGIPSDKFIQVKSPFNAMSYQDIVDDNTALVFVRSEKDKAEQPKPDQTKKNGEPGYLKSYTGKDMESSNTSGYMAYGPTVNFDFSGMQIKSASELRATWPNMSDEDKHKAAALMYGKGHDEAVQLLDKALGGSDTTEAVRSYRSSASDQAAAAGAYNGGKSVGKQKKAAKVKDPKSQERKDAGVARMRDQDEAAKKAQRDRFAAIKKSADKKATSEALVLDKESLIDYLQKAITDWAAKEKDVDKLSYVLKHLSGKTISTRNHKSGREYFTVNKEDILEALRRIHADG